MFEKHDIFLGYSSVKDHQSGTLENIAARSALVSQQSDDSRIFMENMDPGCRILLQIAPCFLSSQRVNNWKTKQLVYNLLIYNTDI